MSRIGFSGGANAVTEEENDFRKKTMDALKHGFRPEFLNRIDEIVIFNPLRKQDLERIVDIQIAAVAKQLRDVHHIDLTVDPAAREYLAREGFSAEFGARPLRRLIQKVILDKLADKIIRGDIKDGSKAHVNFKADSLVIAH
jgi:ATP-dependent Clp protease ATP-binding subunit ClpA